MHTGAMSCLVVCCKYSDEQNNITDAIEIESQSIGASSTQLCSKVLPQNVFEGFWNVTARRDGQPSLLELKANLRFFFLLLANTPASS